MCFIWCRLKKTWEVAQPFLFPLIGSSIYFPEIDRDTYTIGLVIILIGFLTRFTIVFIISKLDKRYSHDECIFMAGSWTAKATVQASSLPLLLQVLYTVIINLSHLPIGRSELRDSRGS